MDYTLVFDECKNILREAGLMVPRAKLKHTNQFLSFTDNPRTINLGCGVRFFRGRKRILHTMLHELLHILVYRVPPNTGTKNVFGTPEEWESDQRLHRVVGPKTGYVSRYARTHPEEDLVETAVFVLVGDAAQNEKTTAVERWFKKIQRHKQRR